MDSLLGYETYGHKELSEDAAVMRDRLLDVFGDPIPDIQRFITIAPISSDLAEWFRWACPYYLIRIMQDEYNGTEFPASASVVYQLNLTDAEVGGNLRARRFYAQSHHGHLLLRCQFLCMLSAYELLPPCYPT